MANLSSEGYVNHLKDIKIKLVNFLHEIDSGNLSYVIEIAAKLRILYMKKSGNEPLFCILMNKFNFTFQVCLSLTIEELMQKGIALGKFSEASRDSMTFSFNNHPVNWFDGVIAHRKVDIIEAFNKENQINIGSNSFSLRKIVEVIADKMGGAHIDSNVADKDLIVHSDNRKLGGLNIANRVIYDLARMTIQAIEMVEEFIHNKKENAFICHKTPKPI